jgi:hypothetical protein
MSRVLSHKESLPTYKTQGWESQNGEPPLGRWVLVWRLCLGGLLVWIACGVIVYKGNSGGAVLFAFVPGEIGTVIFLTGIRYGEDCQQNHYSEHEIGTLPGLSDVDFAALSGVALSFHILC